MTLLGQILLHTPLWVWPLLGLVVWLGWRDLRPRTIAPARLAVLPAVATTISLAGIATSSSPALSLVAWLAALLATTPAGVLIAARRRIEVDPERGRLLLDGSWFSMALGLSIFAIRYAMGVTVGRNPALASDFVWIVASSAIGGAVAGIGVGWLAGLLLRYRRAPRAGGYRSIDRALTAT